MISEQSLSIEQHCSGPKIETEMKRRVAQIFIGPCPPRATGRSWIVHGYLGPRLAGFP